MYWVFKEELCCYVFWLIGYKFCHILLKLEKISVIVELIDHTSFGKFEFTCLPEKKTTFFN